ncbi:MAG: hypothetical protein AMS15_00705 [Planctomycetes bacterium DG_23]|nr:MAG: hypothetical protein AMS15_00705 [Planctomycetes bacterium DG_23]
MPEYSKALEMLRSASGRFSKALNNNLDSGRSEEIFKWFLASILYGARISETIATSTYKVFEKEGVLTPEKILATGWDGLVALLDEGGYVRYDFKTATKLLEVMKALKENYGGDLNLLHRKAKDTEDLGKRIKALGKGIGDVTVNIFVRELRGIWKKAEPVPSGLVMDAAEKLGIISSKEDPKQVLRSLKKFWAKNRLAGWRFADFEAALVRLGIELRRKKFSP